VKLRKYLKELTFVCGLSLALAAGCSGPASQPNTTAPPEPKIQYLNIATGGGAGTYFPLGGALATIVNSNLSGYSATAQITGASVANVNSLKTGEAQIAFVQNDIAYYAVNQEEMFTDNKVDTLRGLATLYPETCQLVTLKKEIAAMSDLKGKKISVGAAGSGTEANARKILAANGVTYDDISVQYLSFGESAQGLQDGSIDAAFVTAGYPTAAIAELSASKEVIILPIAGAQADFLIAQYPFFTKTAIPAGTYTGQTKEVSTVAVKAMLVVTADMPEDLAYGIVKSLYSNLDVMRMTHPVAEHIMPDSARDGMSISLHPGAEKYFKEQGK